MRQASTVVLVPAPSGYPLLTQEELDSSRTQVDSSPEEPKGRDEDWTPVLLRKLDARTLPLLFLMLVCSYIARVNITYAKVIGARPDGSYALESDLDLPYYKYRWAVSILYFSYAFFDVPYVLLMKRCRPSLWFGSAAIIVGILGLGIAFINSFEALLTLRFFVGLAVAGFQPSVLYYFSFWYKTNYLALRTAIFYGATSIGAIICGLIAYATDRLGDAGYRSWRWFFIFVSTPSILIGFLTYLFQPDYPQTSKFLDQQEKEILVKGLKSQNVFNAQPKVFDKCEFTMTLFDWQTWMFSIIYFCFGLTFHALNLSLPTIIKLLGYYDIYSNLMVIPPNVFSLTVSIVVAVFSDRIKKRFWFFFAFSCLAAISIFTFGLIKDSTAKYFLLCVLMSSTRGAFPILVSWCSSNFVGGTRKPMAIGMLFFLGHFSGAIAPHLYTTGSRVESVNRASFIMGGLLVFAILLSLTIYFMFKKINSNRALLQNKGILEDAVASPILTDKDPRFLYQL